MESKRHERGGSNSDSSPVPPSPPTFISYETTHKSRMNSRSSPSVTDYRSGRSSRNVSPQDKRRRRRRRSRSSERTRKYSRRGRSRSRSRARLRSRDRRTSQSLNRSASRSQSRSRTPSFSRSRSRSRSHSRSGNQNREINQERHRDSRRHYRGTSYESDNIGQLNESQAALANVPVQIQSNAFKNDGSFMEMFKKMQEQMQPEPQPTTSILEEKPIAPPPLMVGKRRGGRILKTGMVAKPKTGQTAEQPKDAWSLYMAEVKKYREVCCQEEDNTRPLVK